MIFLRSKQQGQALVLFALILSFVLMLTLAFIEIAGRYYQLAQVEDALKQATRSSVQTFDYRAFAKNGVLLETHATTGVGCAGITPDSARYYACKVLLTNLGSVSGLLETPEQAAVRVAWTFLPQDGTCSYPNGQQVTFSTPAVCAALQPPSSLSDRDARLGELQFLTQTGRLRDWQQGVAVTLARAGCGADLTVAEWAELPWFGPLEPWLKGGSTVTDVFINGPGREVVIVDKGNRMPTGFTLHTEWIAFVQRQLLLHSALVTPAQVADLLARCRC